LRGQGEEPPALHHPGAASCSITIKLLPEGDISIKQMETTGADPRRPLQHQDGGQWRGRTSPRWPSFPPPAAFRISAASLRNMISKTIFAISNEESR